MSKGDWIIIQTELNRELIEAKHRKLIISELLFRYFIYLLILKEL